jgi:DNA polymerase I-like protein with 3'-5' exonuclease and polymerase domains
MTQICFDTETNTVNKGNPFTASGKLISYSLKLDDNPPQFYYHSSLDFLQSLREAFEKATLMIGFNLKFDLHWATRYGVKYNPRVRVWDCQIAEFIINGQKGSYPSLDECCAKYGLGQKDDTIAEYWKMGIDTEFIPQEELGFYNNLDVSLTYKLKLAQEKVMSAKQIRLCLIMGLDLLVLQEMEYNGVKFNTALCADKAKATSETLEKLTEELLSYSPTRDINLDSGVHLSCLLYGGIIELEYVTQETAYYKGNSKATGAKKGDAYQRNVHTSVAYDCPKLFDPLPKSETKLKKKLHDGREVVVYVTNEDTLKQLKAKTKYQKRLIELLLERAELAKLMDTYYGKLPQLLEKMEWGEYLHGQYNQCVAATGRLSSSAPNMQNFSGDIDQLLMSRYD